MNSWKKPSAAVVVVISLFVVGAIVMRQASRNSRINRESGFDPIAYRELLRQRQPQQIDELAARVNLTVEQRRLVEQIFTEFNDEVIQDMLAKDINKMQRAAAKVKERTALILRDDQKPAYYKYLKELESRRRSNHPPKN